MLYYFFILVLAKVAFAEDSCWKNCTESYPEPICASDGKMYKNRCEFNCTRASFEKNGTLTEKPRFYCVERCMVPLVYEPVCGSNRRTYPNKYAAECEKWAYPELKLTYEAAKERVLDLFITEYEECKYSCQCPKKTDDRTVCTSLGQVFKDGCDFYCAKWYWYKQMKVKEEKTEFCGIFNVFAAFLEKHLLF